jgi:hypothetical protein
MAKEKTEFINPFSEGVNYKDFLDAVGKSTVEDYCKGNLEPEQIEWLVNDLKNFKTK